MLATNVYPLHFGAVAPPLTQKTPPVQAGLYRQRGQCARAVCSAYCSPAIWVTRCMAAWRRICCIGTSGGTGPWLSYFSALPM